MTSLARAAQPRLTWPEGGPASDPGGLGLRPVGQIVTLGSLGQVVRRGTNVESVLAQRTCSFTLVRVRIRPDLRPLGRRVPLSAPVVVPTVPARRFGQERCTRASGAREPEPSTRARAARLVPDPAVTERTFTTTRPQRPSITPAARVGNRARSVDKRRPSVDDHDLTVSQGYLPHVVVRREPHPPDVVFSLDVALFGAYSSWGRLFARDARRPHDHHRSPWSKSRSQSSRSARRRKTVAATTARWRRNDGPRHR